MKFVAPLIAGLALAAPASAQDYRVDVFGGTSFTETLFFTPIDYDVDLVHYYGISVDRLDVFVPGLDVGLEYSTFDYSYATYPDRHMVAQTLLVTATYNYEVMPNLDLYGTAGLGVMNIHYNDGFLNYYDNVHAGMVGLGARYSFDQFSVFAEYRSIHSMQDIQILPGVVAEANAEALIIGVGFSF